MKITKRWLENRNACDSALVEFDKYEGDTDEVFIINALMKQNHFDWANWLIVRRMLKPDYVRYAIYAAKQVLHIYEANYPDDKRPRAAIRAAEQYLKAPTAKNKVYAADAADAAADAAYAAYAAACAADAVYAVYAAYAAACAADAVYAACAADAAYAVYAVCAKQSLRGKIIKYGLRLLVNSRK